MNESPRELLLQLSLDELGELLQECTSCEFSVPQLLALRSLLEQSEDFDSAFEYLLRQLPASNADAA